MEQIQKQMEQMEQIQQDQPIISIGVIGAVSDGKSTVVRALSGKDTHQRSTEKIRNSTIRLGYANAKIYTCPVCPSPSCKSTGSNVYELYCDCSTKMNLVRHVSFIDCPGHNNYIGTMLNGTSIMNTTILIEAINNEEMPAMQTIEHLKAIEIGNIPNMAVCINKLDLVEQNVAKAKILDFKSKLVETKAEHSILIPISANFNCNLDVLCDIISREPIPVKELNKPVRMIIVRSYNVNKINTSINDICGGIIGGSIIEGMLNIDDEFMLKPGYVIKNNKYDPNNIDSKKFKCYPLVSTVVSLKSDNNDLRKAISGGLIGVGSFIDPSLAINDRLIGNILTVPNQEQDVYEDLMVQFMQFDGPFNQAKIPKKEDTILINYNARNTKAIIKKVNAKDKNNIKLWLSLIDMPICARIGDYLTLSQFGKQFTILGRCIILDGNPTELVYLNN
jgi:translation initiation factor 2 subunit 3